ncbi:uridine kinase, partial [bacterium]|nr:uridine kinase [bacterium]
MNNNPKRLLPIIGVAGGSGCGKSTIIQALKQISTLPLTSISLDSYYRDLSHLPLKERSAVNFDHPDALDIDLVVKQLQQLAQHEEIHVPDYDFTIHNRRGSHTIQPKQAIVIEGTLVLSIPPIRDRLDDSIFIDTPDDIRLIRRLLRDRKERGRSLEFSIQHYMQTVRPMYHEWIAPCKHKADTILDGMNEIQD